VKLKDWHRCRRYWKKGYNCPLEGVEEHEDDDEEEKRLAIPYRKRSERSLDNPIYPWIVADRLVERARRVQRIFGDPGPGQPVRPEVDEPVVDIPRKPVEVPDIPGKPVEVPPVAAIAPGFSPVKLPYRQPVRSEVWDKGYIKAVQTAASGVRVGAKVRSTVSESAQSYGRGRSTRSKRSSPVPRAVMGKAEQVFASSLPKSGTSREVSSYRPRSAGRDWRKIGASAAIIGTGITAAAIVRKVTSGKGPPAGGGQHMQTPKFRGGGKMPAFGFAP